MHDEIMLLLVRGERRKVPLLKTFVFVEVCAVFTGLPAGYYATGRVAAAAM